MDKNNKELIVNTIAANVPTLNNRIYTTEALQKVCESAKDRIDKKTMLIMHGEGNDIQNIAGIVTDSRLVDDRIQLKVQLLDCCPTWVKDMLESGKFSIIPTVKGTINEDKTVSVSDIIDYRIKEPI